ncbi:hypothetical protein ALP69_200030 [Pseudomonas syringae pv. aceris]|nr:hypothetical protein ALP69_200030 [Pseudomonas syringae pv. aceris]
MADTRAAQQFLPKKTPHSQAFARNGALQFDITACRRYVSRQTAACLGAKSLRRKCLLQHTHVPTIRILK